MRCSRGARIPWGIGAPVSAPVVWQDPAPNGVPMRCHDGHRTDESAHETRQGPDVPTRVGVTTPLATRGLATESRDADGKLYHRAASA